MADQDSGGIRGILQLGVRAINDLNTTLKSVFPVSGGTAATATGGAATLPSAPSGFLIVTLPNGTVAKIALYNE